MISLHSQHFPCVLMSCTTYLLWCPYVCLSGCLILPNFKHFNATGVFTDRVRSTRREVMFAVCSHLGGGGGTPSPSPSLNTSTGPISFLGGGGFLSDWSGQDRGVPHNGVPPVRSGWGVPWPGMGYPCPPSPGIGRQMEYLIRRGRYASCVRAGGLSCFVIFCSVTNFFITKNSI